MLLESNIELINLFTILFWILDAVIACLFIIAMSIIVWLCYDEGRQSKIRKLARTPQRTMPSAVRSIRKEQNSGAVWRGTAES